MAAWQLPPHTQVAYPMRRDRRFSSTGLIEINGIFAANQAPRAVGILQILDLENCYQSAEKCHKVME